MSLDERLRTARPVIDEPAIDLDALLRDSMRVARRRVLTRRTTATIGVGLILLLIGIPVLRNLSRDETDVADRIQKEEKDAKRSPVPTPNEAPGSGPGAGPGARVRERQSRIGPNAKVPSANRAGVTSKQRIAFVSTEPATEIYTMNLDGTGKRLLGPGAEPDWSPDGKKIAYSRGRTTAGCSSTTSRVDPPDPCEVWVMNADGSNQHPLGPGWSPDWSPDGNRIAYGAGQDRSEIHVMSADGSGSKRITDTPNASPSTQGSNSPSWSPDGRWIAFSRRASCGTPCWTNYLYKARVDGSGLSPVAALIESVLPAWSPDGSRIAFTAAGNADRNADVFTVDVDDEDIHVLTQDDGGTTGAGDYDGYPAWSPEGKIAFVSDPDGPTGSAGCGYSGTNGGCGAGGPEPGRLTLMNADGTGVKDLGEGRMPDFAPRS